jgi:hypothetical protein
MKFLSATVTFFLAGMFVFTVWGSLMGASPGSGIWGGVGAAAVIIGSMWFLNHYLNLTHQDGAHSFVDMGLAIFVAGWLSDALPQVDTVGHLVASLPTVLFVAIGAALGGACAVLIEKIKA